MGEVDVAVGPMCTKGAVVAGTHQAHLACRCHQNHNTRVLLWGLCLCGLSVTHNELMISHKPVQLQMLSRCGQCCQCCVVSLCCTQSDSREDSCDLTCRCCWTLQLQNCQHCRLQSAPSQAVMRQGAVTLHCLFFAQSDLRDNAAGRFAADYLSRRTNAALHLAHACMCRQTRSMRHQQMLMSAGGYTAEGCWHVWLMVVTAVRRCEWMIMDGDVLASMHE